MKKQLAIVMAGAMVCSMAGAVPAFADGVDLNVTTTFAGEDGNAMNFKNAVAAWEESTGNTVNDASATSDETFKARVIDYGKDSLLLEFVQTATKNDAVIKLIKEEFKHIEVVRGGRVGIESISMMER